jgi:tRNA pseudouridine38-40 synthase
MRNIKVTLAYDGTNYFGFQEQRGTKYQTIQGVVEERLSKLAKREIRVIGAGRTDTGVHARGQVVNFDAGDWTIEAERVAYALRSLLPEDIVALDSVEAAPSFHARFSALSKSYRYTIYNGKIPSPFLRLYSYHIHHPLDEEAMREPPHMYSIRRQASKIEFRTIKQPGIFQCIFPCSAKMDHRQRHDNSSFTKGFF